MDRKRILPGENRRLAIEKAMQSADFFIACLSTNSVDERGGLQSQFKYALASLRDKLDSDIYLIPVRFEDCEVPDDFKNLQMADLFTDEGQSQLLMALEVGLERRRGVSGVEAIKSSKPEQNVTPGRQPSVVETQKSWEEKEGPEDTVFRVPLRKAGARLPLVMESEHFVVHFALINPPTGRTAASDGVKDRSLVRTYLDALERCYEVMTSEPWIREPPIVGPQGKTAVFVVESAPFTSTDLQMVPYICLPSGNNEPTNKAELDRAAAEAVHEAVHIFNYRERPFHDSYSGAWEWYDCALASFVETIVLPENVDYLRFVDDWIRKPESPLDELDIKNQGFVFIQYLANRMGLDFVNRVWTEALRKESPLDAIARMLPNEQRFVSYEPHHKDIFGSGYCMDSYFFDDSSSKCYMPRAFERYGSRAVAESILLGGEDTKTITDSIDHLACKYYRLCLKDGVQKKQIRLYLKTAGSAAPLKAEATVVKSNGQRLFTESLRMKPAEDATGGEQLISNISLSSSDTDHVILVVSNCGLRSAQNADEHDDNRKFEIIISAT
ncbi:MAG TPA: TIR domain-containing protein [Pyrinomonadaceae bacterium]|nr:TIR domain-containing protein [Pyrinomonadaceae bacterium]